MLDKNGKIISSELSKIDSLKEWPLEEHAEERSSSNCSKMEVDS